MTHNLKQHTLVVAGQTLIADRSGALYWPERKTLIVADLHLEKGSAFARRGAFLPPYDTRETLARLTAAIANFAPLRVVALGDSLHDPDGANRIDTDDLAALARLRTGRRWLWITGNHDPKIATEFGGEVSAGLTEDGIRFVHEPSPTLSGQEICGHLHPAAKLVAKGTTIRRPCFVTDGQRIVMPAFGAFTGGVNVLDMAFAGLFEPNHQQILMLGNDGIYPVPITKLTDD